ncbi:MAG: hypothetical protein JXC85_02750 [Candidatus Aenigmarchaeota archaeon]|nr:hypothetical protein [Candidatus Aenigmarchaeota archaeon]
MHVNVNVLRGHRFIADTVENTPRTCELCTYNNDGGQYTGDCPYFSIIFSVPRTKENMHQLEGKAPGNYCYKWEFGLAGED